MIKLHKIYNHLWVSCIVTLLSMCVFCSVTTVSDGGSEAGNARIAGIIVDESGLPAANTIVKLIPSGYNPITSAPIEDSCKDTTDTNGTYCFSAESDRDYTIEALNTETRFRALATNIIADTHETKVTLTCPGAVRILPPNNGIEYDSGYVFIPGTSFFVKVKYDNGYVILDSVPSGLLSNISFMTNSNSESIILESEVTVKSGDTATVLWQGWNHSQKLILNTSESGANITEDLYDFPVLVRLSNTNFDFSQSLSNGNDIRFTSSRGIILSHEIGLWDITNEQASIWVRVDTIFADNDLQSIMMHWGNADPKNTANKTAVFDTSSGFEGVWHFQNTQTDTVTDATQNSFNGISTDISTTPLLGKGIIGDCRVFDGTDDYITVPNTSEGKLDYPVEGYFTISAWVYLAPQNNTPQVIVGKGYEQYFMRYTYFPSDSPLWEFSLFTDDNQWQAVTTSAAPGEWVLLTGVRNGQEHSLYLNGVLVSTVPNTYSVQDLSRNTSEDITIGRFNKAVKLQNEPASFCYFKGSIDEIRIDRGARSDAWVKLCFMNQQIDDKLVVFTNKP
ncbi:MAG: DUF2341 domain-containing protein [Fibrobacter sp.]|nr:DUF2341 domain-containing protein [Fibrobacter sp.]